MVKIQFVCLFFVSTISTSASAFSLQLFTQAAGTVAGASDAIQDLSSSIDDDSQTIRDLEKFQHSFRDVKNLIATTEDSIGDAEFIAREIDSDYDWTTSTHVTASKVRTAKNLGRRLGLIASAPDVATAVESSRTNILLANQMQETKNQNLRAKERAYQRFSKRAEVAIQKEKSIDHALEEMHGRQQKSNLVFSPFNFSKSPMLKFRIQDLYVQEILGQGTSGEL